MKLKQTINGGKPVWCVDGTVNGKRRRTYFPLNRKVDAEKHLKLLQADRKEVGNRWTQISPSDRAVVTDILDQIASQGLTLQAVWDDYNSRRMTTVDAGLKAAVEAFLADKDCANLSDRYTATLRSDLTNFASVVSVKRVADLTPHDVRLFLAHYRNPLTRATKHTRLGTFFGWCIRNGYHTSNPAEAVERPKVVHGTPEVLTVDECEAILRHYADNAPESLSALVLKLFAGVRPEEARRLTEANVDLKRGIVVLDETISKTRRRRIVKLEPVAVEWLSACPNLTPVDDRKAREAAIAELELNWSPDVLRHTAASHLYNLHGAVETTKLLGNSEGIMHTHYRALIDPDETKRFWALSPSSVCPSLCAAS